jgi:hypothetical protein
MHQAVMNAPVMPVVIPGSAFTANTTNSGTGSPSGASLTPAQIATLLKEAVAHNAGLNEAALEALVQQATASGTNISAAAFAALLQEAELGGSGVNATTVPFITLPGMPTATAIRPGTVLANLTSNVSVARPGMAFTQPVPTAVSPLISEYIHMSVGEREPGMPSSQDDTSLMSNWQFAEYYWEASSTGEIPPQDIQGPDW